MPHDAYRFTTPRPWDKQPGLWVITTLSVLFSLLVFAGRRTIRRQFSGPDIALCIAYVFAATSWVALYVGLSRGAGISADHTSMAEYNSAGKVVSIIHNIPASSLIMIQAIFASNAILVAAQGVASCSQIVHLREIVPSTLEKRVARWTIAAILILIQTVIPAILPMHLFKVLQTPSSKKRSILAAFSFPLLNVVTVGFMLWSYISSMHDSPDGTGLVGLEICLQVLLGWSLICPTIPCMRPLAMRFTTGGAIVLAGEASNNTGTGPSTTRSHTDSQGCRKRRSHLANFPKKQEQDELELNPKVPEGPASTIRTSDDDEQESIGSCIGSRDGIHVSRRYEVSTEETKNKSEIGNMVFGASSRVVASQ
ncbi:hypothetical protein Q7P37_010068 [Cladosporium fusiforme]